MPKFKIVYSNRDSEYAETESTIIEADDFEINDYEHLLLQKNVINRDKGYYDTVICGAFKHWQSVVPVNKNE